MQLKKKKTFVAQESQNILFNKKIQKVKVCKRLQKYVP